MRPAVPIPILLLAACGGPAPDTGGGDGWIVPEVDLGDPVATGSGYVIANGSDAWFAAEQVVPGMDWSYPGSDLPLFLWDLVQGENIADSGSCPYVTADASTGETTWHSNCRSQEGYVWTGTVTRTRPTADEPEPDWTRWDFDLEVVNEGDDRPTFDTLVLRGGWRYVDGDDERLRRAVQVNIVAGVDGYWERNHVGDPREEAWHDLALTARYEEAADGTHRFEGAADLGELGGFTFRSDDLVVDESCVGEPDGRVEIDTSSEAIIAFQGEAACDLCAKLVIDDAYAGQACE